MPFFCANVCYRLLLIHYINVSVTNPTRSGNWLNIDLACSSKVPRISVRLCIMALPSMICAALDSQLIVGSMCASKKCIRLDLSVRWSCQRLIAVYKGNSFSSARYLQAGIFSCLLRENALHVTS